MASCNAYSINEKYGQKNMLYGYSFLARYSLSVSCDIKNGMEINYIVKSCSVKLVLMTGSLKTHVWDKTKVMKQIYFISCFNDTNMNDMGKPDSLSGIAKCSRKPSEPSDCLRYMWSEIPLIWVQQCVKYITPMYSASMKESVMQGMQQKYKIPFSM